MNCSSRKLSIVLTLLIAGVGSAPLARAHCEIPCGIYRDAARAEAIAEDCRTIEKSMAQINELSGDGEKNYNQLVRWVSNKEEHANKIQHVVTQYFMTQRIKPGQPDYEKKVVILHQMLLSAMKCKQTTDMEHVAKLRDLLGQFSVAYFGEEAEAHIQEHQGSGAK